MPNRDILLRAGACKLRYYGDVYTLIRLEISRRTRWWCLKCVIVYLARDISGVCNVWSLWRIWLIVLIESTDSMIFETHSLMLINKVFHRSIQSIQYIFNTLLVLIDRSIKYIFNTLLVLIHI